MTAGDSDFLRRLLDGAEPVEPSDTDVPAAPSVRPFDPDRTPDARIGGTEPTFVVRNEDWDQPKPRISMPPAGSVRPWRDERVRHGARLALFALAVIGGLLGLGELWIHLTTDPLADVRAYYDAATRLNHGQPLYAKGIGSSTNEAYLYPPLLAIVMRPLALLPYAWFALLWEAVVVGSFIVLLRRLGLRSTSTWIGVGLLGIPLAWALAVAQAHVPMTLLLSIGQPWSIALATNLKLVPALVAVWWIGRRQWQTIAAYAVWMVLLGVLQLVIDARDSLAFFGSVGFGQIGADLHNLSPYVISPILWAALLAAGVLVTLALSRTRWGWAATIALVTFAPPRLLLYMLTGLLAALRAPKDSDIEPEPLSRTYFSSSGPVRR